MGTTMRSVGFNLRTDGKAEVKNDFAEVGKAGQDAMAVVGDAAQKAANDAGDAMDRYTKRQTDAFAKQAAAARVAAAGIAANATFDQTLGTAGSQQFATVNLDRSTGSARDSATAFQAMFEEQEAAAAAAERLRAAIDPLYLAQQRYDNELRAWKTALASGEISEEQHAAAVAVSTQRLKAASDALDEGAEATGRMGSAGMIAEHVVRSFSDSIAAGQPPIRAFAMESGRVVEGLTMWAQQTGQTEGAVGKLAGFLGGPWGLALSVGLAVVIPLVTELFHTEDGADAARKALEDFANRQGQIGNFIDATTGRLTEQNRVLVQNAVLLRQKTISDNADKAKDLTKQLTMKADAAGVTGSRFVAERQASENTYDPAIAKAVAGAAGDPQKIAEAFVALGKSRPDLRSAIQDITGLAGQMVLLQRDSAKASTEIDQLTGKTTAHSHASLQLVNAQAALAAATTPLGRARAELTIVEAGGEAAEKAGGKTLDDYRTRVTAAMSAVASAEAAQKAGTAGTREHTKEMNAAARQAAAFQKEVDGVQLSIGKLSSESFKKFSESLPADLKAANEGLDAAQKDRMAPGVYAVGQLSAQKDALATSQAELDTIGMSADARGRILDLTNKTLDLQRQGVPLDSDQAKAILAGVAAQDEMNARLRVAAANMNEVSQFGDDLADKVLSPDAWKNWGDTGKAVLKEIENEFIKLALLDPIKNMLNGNSNAPTLGSLFGSVSKLLGGASSLSVDPVDLSGFKLTDVWATPAHNATGSLSYAGGPTYANENGGEIFDLPTGTRIYPAAESRAMMAQSGAVSRSHVTIGFDTDMFTARVVELADQRIAASAPGIAYGASAMTEAKQARRARYRIPGR